VVFGREPAVRDAGGDSPAVFVCADPEALVPALAQQRLLDGLEKGGYDLVTAVSNEAPGADLRRAPPFAYATPSGLDEVSEIFAGSAAEPLPVSGALPVFAVRRVALEGLPPALPLAEAPAELLRRGGRLACDPGAYVHRYAEMDASERVDLAEKIPPGAKRVLDVGCAQGATATALRKMGVEEIFGIEPDPGDAALAAKRYDRVVASPLSEVSERWEGRFDAVLFGDVLEHLEDPAAALRQVRPWLSGSGRVIASVPNIATAAVIGDLLRGRFDYVPYSVLSGTHIRFFTRETLAELFESCGYLVLEIAGTAPEPTPEVRDLLGRLKLLPGASPDLAATELTVVACRLDGG
jgi:2-polyprenyl-3-methyl-5-hydroxy-6-metoxy-1,4-benzoquinol methylase